MRFLLLLSVIITVASLTQGSQATASEPAVGARPHALAKTHAEPPKLMQIDTGVFRGIQPETPEDYAALKKAGIHTIMNFRWDKSVAQSKLDAEANGFKFVNVPINAVRGPKASDLKTIFETIKENKANGILFHCTLGRDRTGLIAALYRVNLQGYTPEAAYKEWTDFGFSNSFLKKLDEIFWTETEKHSNRHPLPSKKCVDLFGA